MELRETRVINRWTSYTAEGCPGATPGEACSLRWRIDTTTGGVLCLCRTHPAADVVLVGHVQEVDVLRYCDAHPYAILALSSYRAAARGAQRLRSPSRRVPWVRCLAEDLARPDVTPSLPGFDRVFWPALTAMRSALGHRMLAGLDAVLDATESS